MILYGTFLGTDGAWYQWMRRFGIVFYFGFTCIAMLIVGDAVRRTAVRITSYRRAAALLLALCVALPLLGVANALAPLVLNNAAAVDAFENATEWWGGLVFTVFFAMLAALCVAPGGSAPPIPSAARRGFGIARSGRESRLANRTRKLG